MARVFRFPALLGAFIPLVACGEPLSGVGAEEGLLGADEAARVRGDFIFVQTVREVAEAQGLSLSVARDRLIADALFAAASEDAAGGTERLRRARRVAASRAMLQHLQDQVRAGDPPAAAELARAASAEWWLFDRPEMRRAVHAVVRIRDPADDEGALGVAEAIYESVRDARTPTAFAERARAVSRDGLEVRIEELAPCTADGRVADPERPPAPGSPGQKYAEEFAEALFLIDEPFVAAPPFRSSFGLHVAMVTERIPERRLNVPEVRQQLEQRIETERIRRALAELLEAQRTVTAVTIERAALSATAALVGPR
jgi:hypothetical protein